MTETARIHDDRLLSVWLAWCTGPRDRPTEQQPSRILWRGRSATMTSVRPTVYVLPSTRQATPHLNLNQIFTDVRANPPRKPTL